MRYRILLLLTENKIGIKLKKEELNAEIDFFFIASFYLSFVTIL